MTQHATEAGGRQIYVVTVIGVALGMAFGFAAIFISTNGVFIPAVVRDFHWGRAQAAESYAASMLGLAIVSPLVGTLMDRFGVRRVVLASAFVFALALACMGLQDGHPVWWIVLSLVIGMSGAATSVLGYLAILPQWFDRRLGLAIGLAMVGLGIGTIVMPALSQFLITGIGWRGAYQVLAGMSLMGALMAFALTKEKKGGSTTSREHARDMNVDDASPHAGTKLLRIAVIFLSAFLASTAVLSLGPHLPALLIDRGISAHDAARSASLVGFGILIGRLASGMLVDRVHAPIVACLFFAAGATGFVLLKQFESYPSALCASVLVGLAVGAEGDLLSYMVRSYIGLKRFGLFYGIAFSGYAFGAVLGPIAVGRYFDLRHNYGLPLQVAPFLLLASGVLLLSLGSYVKPGTRVGGALKHAAAD